jgi:hypothetical protein
MGTTMTPPPTPSIPPKNPAKTPRRLRSTVVMASTIAAFVDFARTKRDISLIVENQRANSRNNIDLPRNEHTHSVTTVCHCVTCRAL